MIDTIQYYWPWFDVWDFPADEPVPHVRIYARSRWGHETWCSLILDFGIGTVEYYVN